MHTVCVWQSRGAERRRYPLPTLANRRVGQSHDDDATGILTVGLAGTHFDLHFDRLHSS